MSLANHNRTQGVQCRTMTSQRPCGAPQCTRPECVSGYARMRERVEALRAPESDERTTGEGEPLYTLEGLSARDLERLEQALRMLRRTYTKDSPAYWEVSALGHRVSGLK